MCGYYIAMKSGRGVTSNIEIFRISSCAVSIEVDRKEVTERPEFCPDFMLHVIVLEGGESRIILKRDAVGAEKHFELVVGNSKTEVKVAKSFLTEIEATAGMKIDDDSVSLRYSDP
jgi:hypothetical protein